MSEIVLTDANFSQEVMQSQMPVLVDFWAPWCGPCKIIGPIVDELATEYSGKLKVGKLNVDENNQTANAYGVMSIPTIILFSKGKAIKTMVGAQSKEALKREIDAFLHQQ